MSSVEEVIVLAGGFGTRLRSVVDDVPKPLAPVAGRPFLDWLLEPLAAQGVRRCILAVGYLAEMVEDALGSSFKDMSLSYSVESEPLGTGGAIALASRQLSRPSAHVINGDTFLDYDLRALEHLARTENALGMALAHVDDVARYGAVQLDGARVRGFSEKGGHGPGWINAGCYFLDEAILSSLPMERFSFEQNVLQPMANSGAVVALTATSRFIDIGVPEDFARAQRHFGDPE